VTPAVGLTEALQCGKHFFKAKRPLDVEEDLRNITYIFKDRLL
jgi:hypothetical protein